MIAAIGLEQRSLTVLVFLCCLSSPAAAHEEDWSKFQNCLEINGAAVEQAEPSVSDGAKLIVDVICNEEAADLGNQMMRNPERKDVIQQRGSIGAVFEDFFAVMRREATRYLFNTRKQRLGL